MIKENEEDENDEEESRNVVKKRKIEMQFSPKVSGNFFKSIWILIEFEMFLYGQKRMKKMRGEKKNKQDKINASRSMESAQSKKKY